MDSSSSSSRRVKKDMVHCSGHDCYFSSVSRGALSGTRKALLPTHAAHTAVASWCTVVVFPCAENAGCSWRLLPCVSGAWQQKSQGRRAEQWVPHSDFFVNLSPRFHCAAHTAFGGVLPAASRCSSLRLRFSRVIVSPGAKNARLLLALLVFYMCVFCLDEAGATLPGRSILATSPSALLRRTETDRGVRILFHRTENTMQEVSITVPLPQVLFPPAHILLGPATGSAIRSFDVCSYHPSSTAATCTCSPTWGRFS